jgi:1,2-diacylglycerol 3-alpha-glucosyltransferase
MFTNTFHPMVGGLETSVATTHEELLRAGHLCRVITPQFDGACTSTNGVLRLPAWRGVGRRKFSIPLPSSSRIRNWVDALEPEILHAHQPFLLGDTAWRLAVLRGIPLVFTHHTFYERYAHCLRINDERARRMVIELSTEFCNRSHLVIAPTQSVRRILLERQVTSPIEVVPSGIDREFYASGCRTRGRVALGLGRDEEVVGHVGRISQEKNLEFMIGACLHLLHERPKARLLLIGDGDRLQWARQRIADAGLAQRLVAPGILLGAAVADAYAAMDVFVFASLSDTQGLVLAEAMAAAVPTIALQAPGAGDCIEHECSGVLLPASATEREFAAAVAAMLANPARRRVMAARAYECSQLYSRRACLDRLLEAYAQALQRQLHTPHAVQGRGELAPRWRAAWLPVWEKLAIAARAASLRPTLEGRGPAANS